LSSTPEPDGVHRSPTEHTITPLEAVATLTARQREVLALIGQGLSTAEIARRLYRTVKTIESHRLVLGKRLGARNRVELARIAIQAGLSELPASGTMAGCEEGEDAATEGAACMHADEALRAMVQIDAAIAGAGGDALFGAIVRQLGESAGAVGTLLFRHGADGRGTTVAGWLGSEAAPVVTYSPREAEDAGMGRGEVRTIPGVPALMLAGLAGDWAADAGVTMLTALHGSSGQRLGTLALVLREAETPPSRTWGMVLRVLGGRVSAELERREAEERLASMWALLEKAGGVGLWERDLHDGRVTRWVGSPVPTTREELLAMVHPEDRARVAVACDRATGSEASASVECRVRGRDGHERRMLMCCGSSPDSAGRPGWVFGAMRELNQG
jgi:DNA-binding CsgD family transcriptional regulator/PAS domain-containing protein